MAKVKLIKRSSPPVQGEQQPPKINEHLKKDSRTGKFHKTKKGKNIIDDKKISHDSTVPLSSDVVVNDDYKNAWKLLEGRTVTHRLDSKDEAIVFDGKVRTVKEISSLPNAPKDKGIRVTRQKTTVPSWKKEDILQHDCIVLEFDDGLTQQEQVERLKKAKIPYSMVVWSGNKSVHCFVILDERIDAKKMIDIQDNIKIIFPESDHQVLNNMNQLVRFPIEGNGYGQKLLDVKKKVKNSKFFKWLDSKMEDHDEEAKKTTVPVIEAQDSLEKIWEENGRKSRVKCPICASKGKDSTGNNLQLWHNESGQLLFHCFRCKQDNDDYQDLKAFFLTPKKKDPNAMLEELQKNIEGRFAWNGINGAPAYRISETNGNILLPVEPTELTNELWGIYEPIAKKLGMKVSKKSFMDELAVLKLKNSIIPKMGKGQKVPLQDGHLINLKKPKSIEKLTYPVDFHLPITKDDWLNPVETPIFDKMCDEHFSKEDKKLLQGFFGYILSGENVKRKEAMLIIQGPHNSGKSTLLDLLYSIIAEHSCRCSVTDCLNDPSLASKVLGKRLAISSEAAVKAKDGPRFRSLVSGEELRYHIFYEGRSVVSHNAVFVAATNEEAWLEDSKQNIKRIRVVYCKNTIKSKEIDLNFLDKLKSERAGIIVKCLRVYRPFMDQRFKINKSTSEYMAIAGRNVNSVKDWIHENEIKGGKEFVSTKRIFKKFKDDRCNKNIDIGKFSKAFQKEVGSDFYKKKDQKRGYYVSGKSASYIKG